jgi:hypothetical protein
VNVVQKIKAKQKDYRMSEHNQDKKEKKHKDKDEEVRDLDPKKDPKGGAPKPASGITGGGTGGLGPPPQ